MKLRPTMTLALLGLGMAQGAYALSWVGNVTMWQSGQPFPRRGAFTEPWQPVTITAETWPIEPGQQVVAVVETNGWATAQEYVFTFDRNVGNNSRWYLRLPTFPQGTQVNFYIRATKLGQQNGVFDNNNGGNFGFHQRFAPNFRRGAILQWFETPYRTIMQRLPEVVEAGYSAIYLPAPSKAGGGGLSVGYNPVDRFDLGDRPQKGSTRTKYGTTQELFELIRVAKRMGIEVYCDLVLNHNDNRSSHAIDRYPDMLPEDFHIRSSSNTGNNEINFGTEGPFSFGMLNHELVGLVDIAHEDGNNTQTGPFNLPPYATWNMWGKPSFTRNPRTPQYYLDGNPRSEDVREYLERWSKWLISVVGFDGFRLDAVKHMPPAYLGYAPDQAAVQGFTNGNLMSRLYNFDRDLYIFGETYSNVNYELREYGKVGINLLDFPLKFKMGDVLNSNGFGHLGQAFGNGYTVDSQTGLAFQQGGLTPDAAVSFVQSHDDGPPASNNLGHALILGRPGRAKIYYDGNNVAPNAWSNFPRPGRGDAIGNFSNLITRMVDANARFGRGYSFPRWNSQNIVAFERHVNGRSVMLVGLNNNGLSSQTINIPTAFAPGTVLRDYANGQPDVTVNNDSWVTITIPSNGTQNEPNNGRGYVMYGRVTPTALPNMDAVQAQEFRPGSGPSRDGFVDVTPSVIPTPGGIHEGGRSFRAGTVTSDTMRLRVRTTGDGASAFVRFNNGWTPPGFVANSNTPEGLTDGFVPMGKRANGDFFLNNLDVRGLSDGLHLAKVRVFVDSGTDPGAFSDFNYFFYVRRGLGTSVRIDGDLADLGTPLANQVRAASSSLNRLDALYARNDEQYLYLGLAGRVDAADALTNGIVAFLDTDGANGVNNVASLNDDAGPATRLLSNPNVTLPTGFGADFGLGVMKNASLTSSPEAQFAGQPVAPPLVGAFAGFYRINPTSLNWLEGVPAAISTQIRESWNGPARGIEVAVPLRQLYPGGLGSATGLDVVAYQPTSGETDQFLSSVDPLRGTLGGRPAPTPWLSNQFLPVQPNIINNPGTAPVSLQTSLRIPLNMSNALTQGVAITPGAISFDATRQRFVQTVRVAVTSAMALREQSFLRVELPAGVTLTNQTGPSLRVRGGYIRLERRGLMGGASFDVRLEYTAPNEAAITPTFGLFTGSGVL